MNEHKAHVAKYKLEEVERLKSILEKYKVIAIADMTNMPSVQLQKLRSNLKQSVLITMSKASLITKALDDYKGKIKGIEHLGENIRGMPALLFTNESPFKLASKLKKSKSSAPAKAGQSAPNDIVVPAGPTAFAPGPLMGELGQIGVKATVMEGKIAIKEDTLVLKEGQLISGLVANLLTRLGIEPMEIGINLIAALENGIIYTKDILNVDEKEYANKVKVACQSAFNLAFNTAYPTKGNINLLIKKAFLDSNGLADAKKILTSENVKKELGKASLEMNSLKEKLHLPQEFYKEENNVKKNLHKPVKEEDTKKKSDEQVAQEVLKRLQDEKIAKQDKQPLKKDANFEKEEKVAQDTLRKLQDNKLKQQKL